MSKRLFKKIYLLTSSLFIILALSCMTKDTPSKKLLFANPEEVGFSSKKLTKVDDHLQGLINDQQIAGAVSLIARKGKIVNFKSYGYKDIERNLKMENDAIFQMASMTKPFTTVATMILYEDGYFELDDPVNKYISELQNMKVGITTFDSSKKEYQLTLAEANTEITVRQLLNHTSGFSARWYPGKIGEKYKKIRSKDYKNLADLVNDLSKVPLTHQPGTDFQYGHSSDILAYLVEKISKKTFDEFLKERIYRPLGLSTTGHNIPQSELDRVARYYYPKEGKLIKDEDQYTGEKTTFFGGGSGILSTAEDYYKLCLMLFNKGEYSGKKLLRKSTVELMTKVSIEKKGGVVSWLPGYGFGLGFAIRTNNEEAEMLGSLGEYCWFGGANTAFWIDPNEEIIGIILTQSPHNFYIISKNMRDLVYQAIK